MDDCRIVASQRMTATEITCFEVPKGVFRGVTWPGRERPQFGVWVIRSTGFWFPVGREETFLNIDTPGRAADWKEAGQSAWFVELVPGEPNRYRSAEHGTDRTLEFTLPKTDVPIEFSVLEAEGRTMLVFINPREGTVQTGLFGYMLLNGSEQNTDNAQ